MLVVSSFCSWRGVNPVSTSALLFCYKGSECREFLFLYVCLGEGWHSYLFLGVMACYFNRCLLSRSLLLFGHIYLGVFLDLVHDV